MSNYEEELKNKVPDFEEEEHHHKQGSSLDISATVSAVKIHGVCSKNTWAEANIGYFRCSSFYFRWMGAPG